MSEFNRLTEQLVATPVFRFVYGGSSG